MKPYQGSTRRPTPRLLACALASCLAMAAPAAFAQSTAATVRGQVTVDSAPATDAKVTATNVATGLTRSVQATASGDYSVAGLPPGTYRIDVTAGGQTGSKTITVQVGQTATVNLSTGGMAETAPSTEATDIDTVTVTAAPVFETKTSEIATYVSNKQIESLPQGTRNFLAFADTVPGVQFIQDGGGNTRLRSGAQAASNINVFIDGVGQKSYVLPGGVGGQDSSRGNPFPQSAIGEYKVITQNYKAEFDQISSAAIVAATRSGTNEFQGDFFWDYTTTQWHEPSPAEVRAGRKTEFKEEQYGVNFGGPIIRDRLHFFTAYEAKEYVTPKTVSLGSSAFYTPGQVPPSLMEKVGPANAPFKQEMYFGKLSWSIDDRSFLEFSAQIRREDERIGVGGRATVDRATLNTNDVTRYDLRYQYSGERWLNDAHLTYEDTSWAPHPLTPGNGYILTASDLSAPGDRRSTTNILEDGASPNNQDKGQEGYSLQDDLTFTGWDNHTIKMGFKYKHVEVNAIERHYSNPQFYYDVNLSTTQPYRVEFATGDAGTPGGFTTSKNKQFGIYVQDDWEVNDHLTLNYGLRWDYERTPTYEDYVTPADLAAQLRAFPNINNANAGYNINDYISDGNNRKAFKDAWQPRVGFSYDLNADQRHVIFGGAGRAYDRNLFDYLQVEVNRTSFGRYNFYFTDADGQCRRAAGCVPWDPAYLDGTTLANLAATVDLPREWFLNNNDLKVPYADQFSLGMRNTFPMFGTDWNSEVTLSHVRSYDGIAFHLGNRRPDGTYFAPGTTWGSPWGFDPPFGRIVLVDNMLDTRANSVYLKLDKPYTNESGWGVTLAYTYTDAEQNSNIDGWPGLFDYPDAEGYGWLPARGVAKHRFVGTAIWDGPAGLTFSGKLTLESPKPRFGTNCLPGGNDCFVDWYRPSGTFGHEQFDLAVSKEWDTGSNIKLRARADILNVFNNRNWSGYDDWWGFNGVANPNFGRHNDEITLPTRTFKLSLGFSW